MTDRRRFLLLLPLAALAGRVRAQPRPYRVAYVTTERKGVPSANVTAFRAGLKELGYVEGRDIVVDVWFADGSGERVIEMMPEVMASKPDLVVGAGGLALFAILKTRPSLPIVFSISADPVEAKIVQSYARPGGNMTGISLFSLDLVGKRLDLLKQALPHAKRIALVVSPQHPGERLELAAAKDAAQKLGLVIRYFPVTSEKELEAALADIARERDDAILAFADGFTLQFAGRIAEFARKTRIPAIDGWEPFARAGNLMTYGPVIDDVYRRLASYVDKIRKGAAPGDLPVERPIAVELVVNQTAAKQLGIVLSPVLLTTANKVI
ncbi:MAG: ABC transporter substrate-binding protein [Burkholderiales bacterium]